jgi:hypothetical protein
MSMSSSAIAGVKHYPSLVVFDLDMCLWSPEMYTLDHQPTSKDVILGELSKGVQGVVAVTSGHDKIRVFPDALKVLQEFEAGAMYPNTRLAIASSADTPQGKHSTAQQITAQRTALHSSVPKRMNETYHYSSEQIS